MIGVMIACAVSRRTIPLLCKKISNSFDQFTFFRNCFLRIRVLVSYCSTWNIRSPFIGGGCCI